jgi:hypothetical protein
MRRRATEQKINNNISQQALSSSMLRCCLVPVRNSHCSARLYRTATMRTIMLQACRLSCCRPTDCHLQSHPTCQGIGDIFPIVKTPKLDSVIHTEPRPKKAPERRETGIETRPISLRSDILVADQARISGYCSVGKGKRRVYEEFPPPFPKGGERA